MARVSLVPVPAIDRDARLRGPLGDRRHGDLDEAVPLRRGQRGRLARRAHRDQAVDPGQDLPRDEPAIGGLVDAAVAGEGVTRAVKAPRSCGIRWSGVEVRDVIIVLLSVSAEGDHAGRRGGGGQQVVDDGLEGVETGARGSRTSQRAAARAPSA